MRRLLLIGLALFAAAGLLRLRFEANVLDLLPPDLPEVRGLQIFLKHFGLPSELIVTIEGPDAETTAVFANSLAAALPGRVRSTPPWIENPESLVPLASQVLLNQPPERFRATLDKLDPQTAAARASEALRELATAFDPAEVARRAYDPLGLLEALPAATDPERVDREFSSAGGTFRILYVSPDGMPKNLRPPPGWIDQVVAEIETWRDADPVRQTARIGWTGEPAFVHEISRAMSWDMRLSSFLALGFAAALFYAVHRRVRPLARMLAYVVASFLGALGFSAWIFPDLSMISVGFAAILAGITVDYGFLLYQCRLRAGADVSRLRAAAGRGIGVAAATTAAAFASLNFSGLPGIAQLGTTVAIGVLLGAFLMLRFFAADLCRMPLPPPAVSSRPALWRSGWIVALALVALGAGGLLWRGFPAWALDTQSMRPRASVAYPALDRLERAMGYDTSAVSILATGPSIAEVSKKLAAARSVLQGGVDSGAVRDFELPDALWPHPPWRAQNLAAAAGVVSGKDSLVARLEHAGFSESGTALTAGVLEEWKTSGASDFSGGESFDWIARRTMSREAGEFAACGFFLPSEGAERKVSEELARGGVVAASWSQLGAALAAHALTRGLFTLAGFFAAIAGVLLLAFRNLRNTLLALGVNLLGLAVLNGAMSLLGMEWNFMNLCALTLTIGLGVDYSIHVIFALRSPTEHRDAAFADVSKALGLCALTTVAGFASLAFAQTEGLASLGRTCALGVAINAAIALLLLPRFVVSTRAR